MLFMLPTVSFTGFTIENTHFLLLSSTISSFGFGIYSLPTSICIISDLNIVLPSMSLYLIVTSAFATSYTSETVFSLSSSFALIVSISFVTSSHSIPSASLMYWPAFTSYNVPTCTCVTSSSFIFSPSIVLYDIVTFVNTGSYVNSNRFGDSNAPIGISTIFNISGLHFTNLYSFEFSSVIFSSIFGVYSLPNCAFTIWSFLICLPWTFTNLKIVSTFNGI